MLCCLTIIGTRLTLGVSTIKSNSKSYFNFVPNNVDIIKANGSKSTIAKCKSEVLLSSYGYSQETTLRVYGQQCDHEGRANQRLRLSGDVQPNPGPTPAIKVMTNNVRGLNDDKKNFGISLTCFTKLLVTYQRIVIMLFSAKKPSLKMRVTFLISGEVTIT